MWRTLSAFRVDIPVDVGYHAVGTALRIVRNKAQTAPFLELTRLFISRTSLRS
jgi:hypothetical protein